MKTGRASVAEVECFAVLQAKLAVKQSRVNEQLNKSKSGRTSKRVIQRHARSVYLQAENPRRHRLKAELRKHKAGSKPEYQKHSEKACAGLNVKIRGNA